MLCDRCKSDMEYVKLIYWKGHPNPAKLFKCDCGYEMVYGLSLW